jgi:hypothetical protein
MESRQPTPINGRLNQQYPPNEFDVAPFSRGKLCRVGSLIGQIQPIAMMWRSNITRYLQSTFVLGTMLALLPHLSLNGMPN